MCAILVIELCKELPVWSTISIQNIHIRTLWEINENTNKDTFDYLFKILQFQGQNDADAPCSNQESTGHKVQGLVEKYWD